VPSKDVHIRLPEETDPETLSLLKGLIDQCRGGSDICLHLSCEGAERLVRLGPAFCVRFNEKFSVGVQGILGDDAVWTGTRES